MQVQGGGQRDIEIDNMAQTLRVVTVSVKKGDSGVSINTSTHIFTGAAHKITTPSRKSI
jgi:hypothetical protein